MFVGSSQRVEVQLPYGFTPAHGRRLGTAVGPGEGPSPVRACIRDSRYITPLFETESSVAYNKSSVDAFWHIQKQKN